MLKGKMHEPLAGLTHVDSPPLHMQVQNSLFAQQALPSAAAEFGALAAAETGRALAARRIKQSDERTEREKDALNKCLLFFGIAATQRPPRHGAEASLSSCL